MRATNWKDEKKMEEKILELLKLVDLNDLQKKLPHQLSGGEQQRVAIARALINDPVVIMADEPTGNLDPVVANKILDLFIEINKKGTAVIMGTHQHNFLKMHPARVLLCKNHQLRDVNKEQVIKRMI